MKISQTNSQIVLKLFTPSLAEVSGDYDYVIKSDSSNFCQTKVLLQQEEQLTSV